MANSVLIPILAHYSVATYEKVNKNPRIFAIVTKTLRTYDENLYHNIM